VSHRAPGRERDARRVLLLAALLGAASCRTRPYDLLSDADPSDPAGDARDLSRPPDLAQPDLTPPDDCPAEAKLVYVVDANTNVLSSFRPDTLAFTDIGVLACPAPAGFKPGSMGVERDGTAWIEYADFKAIPSVFRVDVRTAACDPMGRSPSVASTTFGMAFALDSGVETLYLLGSTPTSAPNAQLVTLDLTTFQIAPRGTVMGDGDMTDDANGHLFAFLPDWSGTQDTRVIDLDKTSGAPLQTWTLGSLNGLRGDVAIAAWGGVLWLFVGQGPSSQDGTTAVFRLDPISGQLTTAISDTGRHVVGAGVAPCK
jgi:hypothetical protein